MPLYEYKCGKCEKITEELQSINNTKNTIKCECGCTARKMISNTTFVLKGGGWAKDSYSKQPNK